MGKQEGFGLTSSYPYPLRRIEEEDVPTHTISDLEMVFLRIRRDSPSASIQVLSHNCVWKMRSSPLHRSKQYTYLALATVLLVVFIIGCSNPTATSTPAPPQPTASVPPQPTASEVTGGATTTGVEELDRVIRIVLDGDLNALRSIVLYTRAECTFEDGLGGPPKCREGEVEGQTVEVLPFKGPEGHFIRKEDIGTWTGIRAADVYAVYAVPDTAFTDPNYPDGAYAVAFIDEGGSTIITLQIRGGQLVRVDTKTWSPPKIRPDVIDTYLILPRDLDQ